MLVKLRHWRIGQRVDLPRPAADQAGADVLPFAARCRRPAKRSTRSSSNASPRSWTSRLSPTGCTSRALADQRIELARARVAGTRCASGVVKKPLPRSQRPLTTAKPSPSSGATVAESSVSRAVVDRGLRR